MHHALLCCLVAADGLATDTGDVFSILEEEEKVITVGRAEQRRSETTLAVEIITSEMIANSGIELLPELLRRFAGLDVNQTTFSDFHVSMRGNVSRIYEPDKVLLLVDGRPITNDAYGTVPWNTMPVALDMIERIEVVRGPGTAMYGGIGMVGVVNVLTKPIARRPALSFRVGLGSYTPSITPAPWPIAAIRSQQSIISENGKHEFSLGFGTYNAVIDARGMRELRYPSTSAQGLYAYKVSDTQRFTLSYYGGSAARNFIRSTADRAPSQATTASNLLGLEYVIDARNPEDWSLQARATAYVTPYFSRMQQVRLTGEQETLDLPVLYAANTEVFVRLPLPGQQQLTAGVDGRLIALQGGEAPLAFDASVFALDAVRLAPWAILEAAMRVGIRAYASNATPARALVSPRLGFAFPVHPQHTLRFSAAYSQRPPSPLDLFSREQVPFTLLGNPALAPEGVVSLDAAYALKLNNFDFGVTPYAVLYHALRERSATLPQVAQNGGLLPGFGTEVTFATRPTAGVDLRANYSLALHIDRGGLAATGSQHKANLMLDTQLPAGFGLNVALGYVSRAFYDGPTADTFPLSVRSSIPGRFYADLSARWLHGSGWGLQLSAYNIGRVGAFAVKEYVAVGAQPPPMRVMLAVSYQAAGPTAGGRTWQERWYTQVVWAVVGLALFSLPIIAPESAR